MEIKLGTNLLLAPYDEETDEKFKCKVVDQQGDILFIDYPVSTLTHRTAFLMEGTRFRASYIDEAKIGFSFKTTIMGREKGNIPTLKLALPSDEEFEKVQRREYVRVETPVDVAIYRNEHYSQYVSEDISAGGLAIITSQADQFKPLEQVELTIALPFENREEGVKYVQTSAEVIRVIDQEGVIIVPLKFMNTDEIDKQHILRFCFERQLLIRKKETKI